MQTVSFSTDTATASFSNLASLDRDAGVSVDAARALPLASADSSATTNTLVPLSSVPAALSLSSDAHATKPVDVLHVIIRKTAHVSWHATADGQFELCVAATATASDVKERALSVVRDVPPRGASPPEAAWTGNPAVFAAEAALYFRGRRLRSNRPLMEYGLRNGDVLDLVPWHPAEHLVAPRRELASTAWQPHLASDAAAPLESPSHPLFETWQRALSGLRAGALPLLDAFWVA